MSAAPKTAPKTAQYDHEELLCAARMLELPLDDLPACAARIPSIRQLECARDMAEETALHGRNSATRALLKSVALGLELRRRDPAG